MLPLLRRKQRPSQARKSASTPSAALSNKESPTADPLELLNQDILHIVFSYLSENDLIRCQRVSHAWRLAAQHWVDMFGFRLARLRQNVQAMKLRSEQRCSTSYFSTFSGNYAAWIEEQEGNGAGLVHWLSLGAVDERKAFATSSYLKSVRSPVSVANIALNLDGILLLRLITGPPGSSTPTWSRDIVLSPRDGTLVWHQDSGTDYLETRLIPLLIGKRQIYCAKKNQASYNLVACDFRTGDIMYQSLILGRARPAELMRDIAFGFNYKREIYELVQSHNGAEIILEASRYSGKTGRLVSIINGANGQLIQTFRFPHESLRYLSQNPDTGEFVVVSPKGWRRLVFWDFRLFGRALSKVFPRKPGRNSVCPPPGRNTCLFRLMMLQRFCCQPDGALAQHTLDVFFEDKWCPDVTINPFTMTAVSVPHDCHHHDIGIEVSGHSLIPTTDPDFVEAAQSAINKAFPSRRAFPSITPRLNKCFKLGPGSRPHPLKWFTEGPINGEVYHSPYFMPRAESRQFYSHFPTPRHFSCHCGADGSDLCLLDFSPR